MHPTCPYAQRAVIAKELKKIDSSVLHNVEIDFNNPPKDMLLINPDWTVPMVELAPGKGFDDSLLIMEFIDTLPSAEHSLFGNSAAEKALVKFQIHKLLVYVLRPLKLALYSAYSWVPQAEQDKACSAAWEHLDRFVEKNHGTLFGGNSLNAADITLATFFRKAEGAHAYDEKLLLPAKNSPASLYFSKINEQEIVQKVCGTTESIAQAMAPFRGENLTKPKGWEDFLPPAFD